MSHSSWGVICDKGYQLSKPFSLSGRLGTVVYFQRCTRLRLFWEGEKAFVGNLSFFLWCFESVVSIIKNDLHEEVHAKPYSTVNIPISPFRQLKASLHVHFYCLAVGEP